MHIIWKEKLSVTEFPMTKEYRMKRIAILLVVALFTGVAMFADEAVVIDFAKLAADTPSDNPAENQATLTDYSGAAGSSFTDADKATMKTSLAIRNWEIKLNSSANSVYNSGFSYARATKVKDSAQKFKGASVLGVRVMFPTEAYNAYADIVPPFAIPGYADKTTVGADGKFTVAPADLGKGAKFDGYGVVKNVGVIKSISANVFGLNYPETLTVIIKDQNNVTQEYLLGPMAFDGWRVLTWVNPNYITDVRNRELHSYPLYPNSFPLIKLDSFRIYKDSTIAGGDFIGYIKDVSVVYDKAMLVLERDIDDEGTWGILQDREAARRNAELKRLGDLQVQRFIEKRKMDQGPQANATDAKATTAPAANK